MKKPWAIDRVIAHFVGKKRYSSENCVVCGQTNRFTMNNACINCKRMADFTREQKVALEEQGPLKLSDEVNKEFLAALEQEQKGYHDNQ